MNRMSVWWLLSFAGCSEMSFKEAAPSAGDTDESSPPSDSDTGTTGTAPLPEVEYYAIHSTFELLDGAWADSPQLRVDLYDAEVSFVCSLDLPIVEVFPDSIPVDEPGIFAWWRLDLEAGISEPPCISWVPRSWWLGLGAYDTRLDPSMFAQDMLGYDVYSLYLREGPSDPIYVIGVGGTDEMLEGVPDLTVEAPPLSNGRYKASTLVLMSLQDDT